MMELPRFVSVVAVALGCFDIIRGLAHTVFVGHAATELAGLDLTGPTGRDQVVLMIAFGASNFITGAALILLGLMQRFGALILLAAIPVAYGVAAASLSYWQVGLVGQGEFPGVNNMRVYLIVCVLTVIAALAPRLWAGRPSPHNG